MASAVAVQTVAVTSSGTAITVSALPADIEYFFFEASNTSDTVKAYVNYRNRSGTLIPGTAGVSGSYVPTGGSTYVSPKLKRTDYAGGGPVLYAASNINVHVTVLACTDGDA